MFDAGTLVRYGNTGVCRVESIGPPESALLDQSRDYYTLTPLFGRGKIFTPVDTKVPMRTLITREDLEHLVDMLPEIEKDSFTSTDQRAMAEHYHLCIQNGDCEELLGMMKSLYAKRSHLQQAGRKFGQTDDRCMKQAEQLLYGEFAAVLGIEPTEVGDYIENRLQQQNQPPLQ